MGDEFYAIIKLTSGEEIFSLISIDENDGDPLIVMQNPITMKILHSHHGMHIKVKSWIEMSSDDFFIVKLDKIITMTETKDEKLIHVYHEYLNDEFIEPQQSSGKIKPSRSMGYISSVEEARKKLEDIFNNSIES